MRASSMLPRLAIGFAIPCPAMSGAGSVHQLEHRGKPTLRIDVGRRLQPLLSRDAGTKVGEDVTEQVACHHYVEALRRHHKASAKDVDMILVDANVGSRQQWHGTARPSTASSDKCRLIGSGCDMVTSQPLREIEGIAYDSVSAAPRKHGCLKDHFCIRGPRQNVRRAESTHFRCSREPPKVNVSCLRSRTADVIPGSRRTGPQVHILIEVAAYRNQ